MPEWVASFLNHPSWTSHKMRTGLITVLLLLLVCCACLVAAIVVPDCGSLPYRLKNQNWMHFMKLL